MSQENVKQHISPRTRPKITQGRTVKMTTGCGSIYVTVNEAGQGPFEIFVIMGKTGQCGSSQAEALGRCISAGLRSGVSVDVYVRQLSDIRCPSPGVEDGVIVLSCADAVAKALAENITGHKVIERENTNAID